MVVIYPRWTLSLAEYATLRSRVALVFAARLADHTLVCVAIPATELLASVARFATTQSVCAVRLAISSLAPVLFTIVHPAAVGFATDIVKMEVIPEVVTLGSPPNIVPFAAPPVAAPDGSATRIHVPAYRVEKKVDSRPTHSNTWKSCLP